MNEKYLKLNRLYNEMLPRICSSPQDYNRFLQTAAFNFRMSFNNAVAAYAQIIGSDLLLSYNQWQLYGRVPRRYSKVTAQQPPRQAQIKPSAKSRELALYVSCLIFC